MLIKTENKLRKNTEKANKKPDFPTDCQIPLENKAITVKNVILFTYFFF
ncbi:hypothetical protein FLJC2902T_14110 [Flavobacterium limnosediminis JC2902]|uniref:Uncharacterized protein n=1 Tax=Flavobacterium limnosediminis JC2902 TaxID=1341181 RepID=V6SQU0_9FLAO|nr:hypothetical protein FLJC2902T_14110 [Flavobacterium limnosediminis JC2902]